MNLDELPLDLLLWLAGVGWAVYLAVIVVEAQRNRRDDRDARRAARRVSAQRREHGSTDDHEEEQEANGDADEVAEDREERRVIHARSVHRAHVALGQG